MENYIAMNTVQLAILAATCEDLREIILVEMKEEWRRRRVLLEALVPSCDWPSHCETDMETCVGFMKRAYEKWDTEFILREWRRQYLFHSGPLAYYWKEKYEQDDSTETDTKQMYFMMLDCIESLQQRVADDKSDQDLEKWLNDVTQ
jgi:hypothetical protein